MTDPVDTDALRRDARVLAPGFPGVEKRLIAAADEVDRLRVRNASLEKLADEQKSRWLESADDVDRLRSVVARAPHDEPRDGDDGYGCQVNITGKCTCWKADAL